MLNKNDVLGLPIAAVLWGYTLTTFGKRMRFAYLCHLKLPGTRPSEAEATFYEEEGL